MSDRAGLINLKKSIIITLAYFEQFAYPLTTGELWLRLVCLPAIGDVGSVGQLVKTNHKLRRRKKNVQNSHGLNDPQSIVKKLTIGGPTNLSNVHFMNLANCHRVGNKKKYFFVNALVELCDRGVIQLKNSHWFLSATKFQNYRLHRQQISDQKIKQLWPVVLVARMLPWIAGLAITGSVAVGNATKDDDVDVMVITENNRLWLVRPIIILFSFLLGRRRSWNREEPNSWCFNLWLERGSMQMPLTSRSIYTAYEVCQARWLISKDNVKHEFFITNRWVWNYLPNYFSWEIKTSVKHEAKSNLGGIMIAQEMLNILNVIAFQVQHLYMHRHITRERVGYSHAFFHPRDTGRIIHANWKEEVQQVVTFYL